MGVKQNFGGGCGRAASGIYACDSRISAFKVSSGLASRHFGGEVREEEVYAFLRASIGSVWALETLLLLRRDGSRKWRDDELVRELRGSATVVRDALMQLAAAGLVAIDGDSYRFQPSSPQLDELIEELQKIYTAKPVTIIKIITAAPNEKLHIFSDAFKLKE